MCKYISCVAVARGNLQQPPALALLDIQNTSNQKASRTGTTNGLWCVQATFRQMVMLTNLSLRDIFTVHVLHLSLLDVAAQGLQRCC